MGEKDYFTTRRVKSSGVNQSWGKWPSDIQAWPNPTTSRGQSLSPRIAPLAQSTHSMPRSGLGWRQRNQEQKKPQYTVFSKIPIWPQESPRKWNKIKGHRKWFSCHCSRPWSSAQQQYCVLSTDGGAAGSDWWVTQGRAGAAPAPSRGSETNVAEGGDASGRGGNVVHRRLQGNWPKPFSSTGKTHTGDFTKNWEVGEQPSKPVNLGGFHQSNPILIGWGHMKKVG